MGRVGQVWHRSPSELLSIEDEVIAYALDEAVALRLIFDRTPASSSNKAKGTIPAGQRYETPADMVGARVH